MASMAGPPSGRGIDVAYLRALVDQQVDQVEEEWPRLLRVSSTGRDLIVDFAARALTDLEERGLPAGVDGDTLMRQIHELVPEFLEGIRAEAQASGAMIRTPDGTSELPAQLIHQRMPAFMARRCHCWPQ